MKNKSLTILVAILVLLSSVNLIYSYSTANQNDELQSQISKIPTELVVYNGRDGKTPQAGIDYPFAKNGKDGINAISFNTVTVKEVPLKGEQGLKGESGVNYEWRFNSSNGNFEFKKSDSNFWETVISCEKFVGGCINPEPIYPSQPPGDLESN